MRYVLALIAVLGCSGPTKRTPVTTGSGDGSAVGTLEPANRFPKTSAEVRIVVSGKDIVMNGTKISGTPMLADLVAVYGKPDRTWDPGGPAKAANKVHTWDRLGLIAYEPHDGRCISATFPYKAMSTSFTPKTVFSGSFVLDGNALGSKTVLATVKGWRGATSPYSPASIVFDRDDFHVFTIVETKGGSLDLLELSFWQKNRSSEKPVRKPPPPLPRLIDDLEETECKGGDATRCTSLALANQTGSKGRKSVERAFEFAKLGCAGGDPFACLMLGNMHLAGRGVTRSEKEAKIAWKRACTLGYKAACELK